MPKTLQDIPFKLDNLNEVFDNAIRGLVVTAISNNATYGHELIAFHMNMSLFGLKEHGQSALNNVSGIQCMPQSIRSDILGLDSCQGYVNGLDSSTMVTSKETAVTGKYIEYDLGSPCSVNNIVYGNSSTTGDNPTTLRVEYFDTELEAWVEAIGSVSIKSYVAAGVSISITPVVAQKWRVVFTSNSSNTFRYRFLRILADVMPEDVMSKSDIKATWALLVPVAPTESTYVNAGAKLIPAICLEVGGPLDLKPIVLNRAQSGLDDVVSCMHCKIFHNISQEVEVM
ncbi:MAG: hypothetical protein ACRC6V_01480 [Bacteroidales bacterium]